MSIVEAVNEEVQLERAKAGKKCMSCYRGKTYGPTGEMSALAGLTGVGSSLHLHHSLPCSSDLMFIANNPLPSQQSARATPARFDCVDGCLGLHHCESLQGVGHEGWERA